MDKRKAKKELRQSLVVLLQKDDDLIPDEVDPDSREYKSWDAARNELIKELSRYS